jgi:hypothetical protein
MAGLSIGIMSTARIDGNGLPIFENWCRIGRSMKAQAVAVLPFATRYGSARSENRIVLVVALHKRTLTNSNDFDQA